MHDRYKIALYVKEIESFQDAPTDFKMEIEDIKSGKAHEFDFHSALGTEFEFSVSDDNPHLIRIVGFGRNSGQDYTVNLDKKRKINIFEKGKIHRKRLINLRIVDI